MKMTSIMPSWHAPVEVLISTFTSLQAISLQPSTLTPQALDAYLFRETAVAGLEPLCKATSPKLSTLNEFECEVGQPGRPA